MDPSLMTDEEIAERGKVIVDPCQRDGCFHVRAAHVLLAGESRPFGSRPGEGTPVSFYPCSACRCEDYVEAEE